MSDSIERSLLGRSTGYLDRYAPELLYPVPRTEARQALGLGAVLPFHGWDFWHGYELSWLNARGKPMVAMLEATVPCDSPNIIESKSFKLYLNSFNNSRFATTDEVTAVLRRDLSACAGAEVAVRVRTLDEVQRDGWMPLTGRCIDDLDVAIEPLADPAAALVATADAIVEEALYSHLLRSRCPVTGQPDWATVVVRYHGPRIEGEGLLRYIAALRDHQGFHEQIIERMFLDIRRRCGIERLTVYGRFTRRGGLDINPFRTTFEPPPPSLRTVRQ